MNARISRLIFIFLTGIFSLRAEDSSNVNVSTNPLPNVTMEASGQMQQATSAPPQIAETITDVAPVQSVASPATNARREVVSEPERTSSSLPATFNAATARPEEPHGAARPEDSLIWLALAGVLAVSLVAIGFTWHASIRNPAPAPPPARAETPAPLASNLMPVISQAIKEALMQELAAQRRELLTAQQSAAVELASLARRLEAVQTPLLERLGAPRVAALPAAQFAREIPVKISCACGQQYSFDVQPVAGRMPYAIGCPACGQDVTLQANQVIARLLNGMAQPLAAPGGLTLMNSAPSAITPQLVDAVKQAVVKELAPAPAENPKITPIPVAKEHQNGSAMVQNQPGNLVTNLLAEGQALVDAGEFDKAIKCLDTALALQPDRAETLVKLGGVLDKLDRADEALQYYDRAIALDETLTIAYLNKGGLFNRLARYDEALRCYEQALHKQKKSTA